MDLKTKIMKLRAASGLSQEKFAEAMQVSRQAVQKWEAGTAQPDLDHVVKMAQYFNVTLDGLLCDHSLRVLEEAEKEPKPIYTSMHHWQKYSSDLMVEYRQCLEEGLDVTPYEALFQAADKMPDDENRKAVADILFHITRTAPELNDYPYEEPSDIEGILQCRSGGNETLTPPDEAELTHKITGAWYGRMAGCMLGKTVEGMRREELIPFLKETDNYPMRRYIKSTDVTDEIAAKYQFPLRRRCYADTIPYAPTDDDTNYTVLYQRVIDVYSKNFTPEDVSHAWLAWQPKDAYCTAERVAYCNFVKGYLPPDSAAYKNHYREWIGAQIRGDYFGYINPGNPARAAEMAWRDACVSHTKNGIYGEMFVAAMLAAAACKKDKVDVIRAGLAQIPQKSRLYTEILEMLTDYKNGVDEKKALRKITQKYDDMNGHDWCHTISNARIVVAALLYAETFDRAICLAVENGFDTDCNGATVGSIWGMMYGEDCIRDEWKQPFNGKLDTSIFGVGTVEVQTLIDTTLRHIRQPEV